MARPTSKHPTELELEILKILWRTAPATVRQVRDALVGFRDLAYTSVMTIMTIMTEKGYLGRTKRGGSFRYRPRVREDAVARRMLSDVVDRAFDGSAVAAMVNLLGDVKIEREELRALRRLLEQKAREERR